MCLIMTVFVLILFHQKVIFLKISSQRLFWKRQNWQGHSVLIGAQPDYGHIGIELSRKVMGIVEMNTSDNILRYLKEFREKYASMGVSLKKKDGILESAYNTKDRMTVEKFRNPK